MAGNHMRRTLGIVEVLSRQPRGLPLQAIADELAMPKSAAHRLLAGLDQLGWVRKDEEDGRHALTLRLVSLAFRYLTEAGVPDVAQPILDRLARESGEMVRLGVIDGDAQFWVARAQGARSGLRYDPDMGGRAKLTCTASGLAWLAALSDAEVTRLVKIEGLESDPERGPNAPRTLSAIFERIRRTRRDGYARTVETAHRGTSALAAVVRHPATARPLGTISVAGPSIRLTEARMIELAPATLRAAEDMSAASACLASLAPREATSRREAARHSQR